MSIKRLATLAAVGAVAAGTFAAVTAAPANADSLACVDAWNDGNNSVAQEELLAEFADGGAGNVIVGLQEGDCVLAANNSNHADFVVYRKWEDFFEAADGAPGDEFWPYAATIDSLDVVLQGSGQVEPV